MTKMIGVRLAQDVFLQASGSTVPEVFENAIITDNRFKDLRFYGLLDEDADTELVDSAVQYIHEALDLCQCACCLETDNPCRLDSDADCGCDGCIERREERENESAHQKDCLEYL